MSKCFREQLRELWLVALVMSLAPFFIVLYWLVFGGGGAAKPHVLIVNQDLGVQRHDGTWLRMGDRCAEALEQAKAPSGDPLVRVTRVDTRQEAEQRLIAGGAATMFVFPKGLSAAVADWTEGEGKARASVVFSGDLTNPSYLVGSVLAYAQIEGALSAAARLERPVILEEVAIGGSGGRTDFELALPGLFIFAVILLMFPTAMSLAREAESGTLRRLQLTRMSAFDLLCGVSLFQMAVGVVAVLIAFGVAVALGFTSEGPMWAAVLVAAVASLACVGVGLIVACFSRGVTDAFIICNFPMILMMFFSGAMMPLPRMVAFSVGRLDVGVWDFMPTTHAVAALNKILGLGVGFGDVVYELVSLVILTALYFAAGVWLFQRRRLRAA